MTYNLTAIASGNTTVSIFQSVNTNIMDGWLGVIILIVIAAIMYMSFVFSTKQPVKSFTGTAFIMSIISFLLFTLEMIPVIAVWLCVISAALSIAFWNLD